MAAGSARDPLRFVFVEYTFSGHGM